MFSSFAMTCPIDIVEECRHDKQVECITMSDRDVNIIDEDRMKLFIDGTAKHSPEQKTK
jgi:hypothetical protein